MYTDVGIEATDYAHSAVDTVILYVSMLKDVSIHSPGHR